LLLAVTALLLTVTALLLALLLGVTALLLALLLGITVLLLALLLGITALLLALLLAVLLAVSALLLAVAALLPINTALLTIVAGLLGAFRRLHAAHLTLVDCTVRVADIQADLTTVGEGRGLTVLQPHPGSVRLVAEARWRLAERLESGAAVSANLQRTLLSRDRELLSEFLHHIIATQHLLLPHGDFVTVLQGAGRAVAREDVPHAGCLLWRISLLAVSTLLAVAALLDWGALLGIAALLDWGALLGIAALLDWGALLGIAALLDWGALLGVAALLDWGALLAVATVLHAH